MKIRYHHPMVYTEAFKGYDNICKEFFEKVAGPGTVIDHTWSKKGTQHVQYKSCDLLNALETVHHVLDAQDNGFDGVVIGCSIDIGLKESREVANIPVTSIMESAMLFSCMMGKKFSLISFGERARVRQEHLIDEYGLRDRATPVRCFEMSLEELGKALGSEKSKQNLRKVFMEEARKAVNEDKAEVIIPGCGILSALCMLDGIVKVDDMEEVPVLDMITPALKQTEALILMKQKLGIGISRRGLYQSPPKEVIKQVRNF
jgi:allantoin racemase